MDFQWRLDGRARARSDTPDTATFYDDNLNHDRSSHFNETGSNGFEVVNNWRYYFQTRQVALECDFGITTSYFHEDERATDSLAELIGSRQTWDSKYERTDLAFDTPLKAELRRYVRGDLFIQVGGRFRYNYDEDVFHNNKYQQAVAAVDSAGYYVFSDSTTESRQRYVSRRIDFRGEILLGWGRVYSGKYAATAISIVDELEQSGVLTRTPNRAEMLELTRLIHAYREGHGPDMREYRLNGLKTVVAFLRNQAVIAGEDAAVLLVVEDVFDYFTTAQRTFGWSAQIGFGGHDVYYNNQRDGYVRSRKTTYRLNPDSSWIPDTLETIHHESESSISQRAFTPTDYVVLKSDYYRPLSPRWHFSLSAWTRFYLEPSMPFVDNNGNMRRWSLDRRTASAVLSLEYFHDARTTLTFGCSWIDSVRTDRRRFSYFRFGRFYEGTTDMRLQNWRFVLTFGAGYRCSPATVLNLVITYYRYSNRVENEQYSTEEKNRHFDFTAGITHWLF